MSQKKTIFTVKTPAQLNNLAKSYSYLKKFKFPSTRPYMIKIKGVLDVKTMSAFASDKRKNCIGSKL